MQHTVYNPKKQQFLSSMIKKLESETLLPAVKAPDQKKWCEKRKGSTTRPLLNRHNINKNIVESRIHKYNLTPIA